MVCHPSHDWLNHIYDNIYDGQWRRENLDQIVESLPLYFLSSEFIFAGTDILNLCFSDLMGQGRYTETIKLYKKALVIFTDSTLIRDTQIPYKFINPASDNNSYANQHFLLKVNHAHAILMRNQFDEVIESLLEIRDLMDTVDYVHQLKAYFLFVIYLSFGHEQEIEPDIVNKINNLIRLTPSLKLEGLIAIGYYHYTRGDIDSMKPVAEKIKRLLGQFRASEREEISKVTAQQYLYLAVLYRDTGEYDKALKLLETALEQASNINHHVHTMTILSEKATIYSYKHELEEANYWIERAFLNFQRLPEKLPYWEARIEHIRGNIAYEVKDFTSALVNFERVLPLWEIYKRDFHIALANNAIGATLIKLERPNDAIEHLNKAKSICDPMQEKTYVTDLLKVIDTNICNAKHML